MPDFKYALKAHDRAVKKNRAIRLSVEPVPGKPELYGSAEAAFVALGSAFTYDPLSGELMRISGPSKGSSVRPNKWGRAMVAGHLRSVLDMVWIMYTGEIPKGRVYPINGDRTDLRICNLRMEVKI